MKTFEVDGNEDAEARSDDRKKLVESWTNGGIVPHNYKMAPNGQKFAAFGDKGVVLVYNDTDKTEIDGTLFSYELVWGPSSRYFAFMTQTKGGQQALRVVDTSSPETPRIMDVYTIGDPGFLRGIEWSPHGKSIYWIEVVPGNPYYNYLKKVDINSRKITTVARTTSIIDFFMPPVTWFEHGQGPQSRPYSVVYGTEEGLFLKGHNQREKDAPRVLCQAPATGVNNLEWSPDGKKIIMFFRKSFRSRKLGDLRGVMLAHLTEKDPEKLMECLYEGTGIHTLWFSPKGTYITWAKETGCWYRKPDERGKPGFKIPNPVIVLENGKTETITDKPIKGLIWNEDETRLAITAGNQVWVYDANTKLTSLYYEFGDALSHFVAEPRWRGSKLILTVFEDVEQTGAERPRPKGTSGGGGAGAEIPEDLSNRRKFLEKRLKELKEKRRKEAEAEARKKAKKKKAGK